MDEQQDEAGDEEENTVHDAEGEAGLEHRARFVDVHCERTVSTETLGSQADIEIAVRPEVGAVGVGNVSKLIHTSNERTDETEVNEGDEDGRVAR